MITLNPMTASEAKKIIACELNKRGLEFTKLEARKVNFTDLARDSVYFVKVHGWRDGFWAAIADFDKRKGKGFILEAGEKAKP